MPISKSMDIIERNLTRFNNYERYFIHGCQSLKLKPEKLVFDDETILFKYSHQHDMNMTLVCDPCGYHYHIRRKGCENYISGFIDFVEFDFVKLLVVRVN